MGKKKNQELVESLLAVPYWQAGDDNAAERVRSFADKAAPVTVKDVLEHGLELFQCALELAQSQLKTSPLTPIIEAYLAAEMGTDSADIKVDKVTGSLKIDFPDAKTKKEPAPKPKKAKAVKSAPVKKNEDIKRRIKEAKAKEKAEQEETQTTTSAPKKAPEAPAEEESTPKPGKKNGTKKQSVPKMGELRERAKAVGKLEEIKKFGRKRKDIDAFLKGFENGTPAVEVDEEAEIVDGEKTITKSSAVSDAPAESVESGGKGSKGKKPSKGKGFLKTGPAVRADMQDEFSGIEDLLEKAPKKNGKKKKKDLAKLAQEAEDLDLNAIIENDDDDPDMVDLDAIIGG